MLLSGTFCVVVSCVCAVVLEKGYTGYCFPSTSALGADDTDVVIGLSIVLRCV